MRGYEAQFECTRRVYRDEKKSRREEEGKRERVWENGSQRDMGESAVRFGLIRGWPNVRNID